MFFNFVHQSFWQNGTFKQTVKSYKVWGTCDGVLLTWVWPLVFIWNSLTQFQLHLYTQLHIEVHLSFIVNNEISFILRQLILQQKFYKEMLINPCPAELGYETV